MRNQIHKEDGSTLTKGELISTMEGVFNDHGVVSRSEVERMISKAKEEGKLSATPEVPDDLKAFVEGLAETTDMSQEEAAKIAVEYADDFRALRRSTQRNENVVAKTAQSPVLTYVHESLQGAQAPNTPTEPSYAGMTKGQGRISDTLLNGFYISLESCEPVKPVSKAKKGKTTPVGLTAIEEAEEL